MNTRSRIAKFGTTLAVLMSIAALLINNPAKAARPTAVEFNFGMIGITRDQTVRLSTLNLGIEPVNLSINFADQEGRLIKRSTRAPAVYRYTPRLKQDLGSVATWAGALSPPSKCSTTRPAKLRSFCAPATARFEPVCRMQEAKKTNIGGEDTMSAISNRFDQSGTATFSHILRHRTYRDRKRLPHSQEGSS